MEFKHNNADVDMIGRCVAACANGALLSGRDKAFIVWGIEDGTKARLGTSVRLGTLKKGSADIELHLQKSLSPSLLLEFCDFEEGGLHFAILVIEPSYERPVAYLGKEYIRIGQSVTDLRPHTEKQRALWLATSQRKFESATALTHQSPVQVQELLDIDSYSRLSKRERPTNAAETLRQLCSDGYLIDDMEGGFDITHLGALLFAKALDSFPTVAQKSIRVVRYSGRDKRNAIGEREGKRGYAVGFSGLLRYILEQVPHEETYKDGVRLTRPVYPEIALREVIANALIHQDFTITGAGPVVDVYKDRIEVTNPGHSLIETDRMIDERRSRNEKLASAMRMLGLCEERGGGLDKAILEIEERGLPAPDFNPSRDSMCVVLFGPRSFKQLSNADRMRACFHHCVMRWIKRDPMSNTSLRERFRLADDDYQAVSAIISASLKQGRIKPAEEGQGRRNARYVPYWARA